MSNQTTRIDPEPPKGRRGGWCIHYIGKMESDTCRAGIKYDTLPDQTIATGPCFIKPDEDRSKRGPCDKCEAVSVEDDKQYRVWLDWHMGRMARAMQAINPFRKTHRGKSHEIDCPACGTGKLQFSISGYNGHCHAACTTKGCVSWME